MANMKAKETVVDKVWKETDKRNQARAERIGRLEKMLSESKEKYAKANEAYKTAEESLEPEKMIKARRDRDEAGETVAMYERAIERAKAENIYTESELEQIRRDLKMYASEITGNYCMGIGETLEQIEDRMNEAQAERKKINDLCNAIFDEHTARISQVQIPGIEVAVRQHLRTMRITHPQYFQRHVIVNNWGNIIEK